MFLGQGVFLSNLAAIPLVRMRPQFVELAVTEFRH